MSYFLVIDENIFIEDRTIEEVYNVCYEWLISIKGDIFVDIEYSHISAEHIGRRFDIDGSWKIDVTDIPSIYWIIEAPKRIAVYIKEVEDKIRLNVKISSIEDIDEDNIKIFGSIWMSFINSLLDYMGLLEKEEYKEHYYSNYYFKDLLKRSRNILLVDVIILLSCLVGLYSSIKSDDVFSFMTVFFIFLFTLFSTYRIIKKRRDISKQHT